MYVLDGRRIWIAGHRGMVGSALMRRLASEHCELLTIGRDRLDLRRSDEVGAYLQAERPDAIILAAARVGGILANQQFPVDFLRDNLLIATNVIAGAHAAGVDRLLLLGSSCIYPRDATQPIEESALLSGPLEQTNEFYALAKIAGIKLVEAYRRQFGRDYIAAMPANLYGPGDNFDPVSGHVLPALISKAHVAKLRGEKSLTIWGSGTPRREFLHVDDCADALVFLLKHYSDQTPINVGFGQDIAVRELAELICDIVGFQGEIVHDLSKPDGTPRKLMNSDRLRAMGWAPSVTLRSGIADTYQWLLQNEARGNAA
jgi:GDP-L-fucose synthase